MAEVCRRKEFFIKKLLRNWLLKFCFRPGERCKSKAVKFEGSADKLNFAKYSRISWVCWAHPRDGKPLYEDTNPSPAPMNVGGSPWRYSSCIKRTFVRKDEELVSQEEVVTRRRAKKASGASTARQWRCCVTFYCGVAALYAVQRENLWRWRVRCLQKCIGRALVEKKSRLRRATPYCHSLANGA